MLIRLPLCWLRALPKPKSLLPCLLIDLSSGTENALKPLAMAQGSLRNPADGHDHLRGIKAVLSLVQLLLYRAIGVTINVEETH